MTDHSRFLPLISQAQRHNRRVAVVDARGTYTYSDLLEASARVAASLLGGRADLCEERVGFLVAPGFAWVATLWGIWRAGGVAVPLAGGATRAELEFFVEDSGAATLVFDVGAEGAVVMLQEHRLKSVPPEAGVGVVRGLRCVSYGALLAGTAGLGESARLDEIAVELPVVAGERRAMILYTSGTTSRPKGVVTTHANIAAQIGALVEAWEWRAEDRILLCLPLHHVHGIINVVSCALWAGAACRMLPRFDAAGVWEIFAGGELTLFMAVPTVYAKLIACWEAASVERRAELSGVCAKLRVMVSGSAALPVSTLERWKEISGHTLLERYGMTEIGMALSNALHGERVPGSVGRALPGVEVRLVADDGSAVAAGTAGEIEVRGPSVFAEYWGKADATREAFRDGWFRTGDTAVVENGVYRILGRTCIDILKSGGHKISALEIEETLREHPAIAECAVVGVADAEWGERVAAAVVLKDGGEMDLAALRAWAKEFLAGHKVPSRLLVVEGLPRNAMGKVVKTAVAAMFVGP